MKARALTVNDLDWVVTALARRREPLVGRAPIFWRPALEAAKNHRTFVEYLLTEAGAKGFRTDASVLIAAPRGDGWLIDDAYIPGERWADGDGQLLWDALVADCRGAAVRFVCPTHERDRCEFAGSVGLEVAESWWLMELAGSGGGQAGVEIDLPGAAALTVEAPPVYAPSGPILFLPAAVDAARAIPAAIEEAPKLGCAAIVVNQRAGDGASQAILAKAGFRQHCDYHTGTI
jgi:hypothetical protein